MSDHIKNVVQAALHRPIVLAGGVSADVIATLLAWVAEVPPSAWCDGDGSEHSWHEYHLTGADMDRLLGELPLVAAIAALSSEAIGWINRFVQGAWVASHRDAGGDVQCMVPLELPAPDQGGALWIGSSGHNIPMRVSDVLLFNAAALPHGTSQIVGQDARRITINLRFWVSPQTDT